jgi:hypothetical protein
MEKSKRFVEPQGKLNIPAIKGVLPRPSPAPGRWKL